MVAGVLRAGREWLTEPEAEWSWRPTNPDRGDADRRDDGGGGGGGGRDRLPGGVEDFSPDIPHKSDVGGVALDLEDDAQVGAAAERMLVRVRAAAPAARVDGFLVQKMVRRPRANELIVGVTEDAQFGPIVLFGQGGIATEVVADRAIGLPPLNTRLAHDLIAQTRVHRLLRGYRIGRQPISTRSPRLL